MSNDLYKAAKAHAKERMALIAKSRGVFTGYPPMTPEMIEDAIFFTYIEAHAAGWAAACHSIAVEVGTATVRKSVTP
jgi:hypothetical protein